jgi:hypothetical protein
MMKTMMVMAEDGPRKILKPMELLDNYMCESKHMKTKIFSHQLQDFMEVEQTQFMIHKADNMLFEKLMTEDVIL